MNTGTLHDLTFLSDGRTPFVVKPSEKLTIPTCTQWKVFTHHGFGWGWPNF